MFDILYFSISVFFRPTYPILPMYEVLKLETADTKEDTCEFVQPSVASLNDLYGGAHVQLNGHGVHAGHAIVKGIDVKTGNLTVIYKRNICKPKAEVIEETIQFPMYCGIRLFNYGDSAANHLVPQFTRLPSHASVSIAEYLKNNNAALQSCTEFRNNCEHFAVACTLGYDFSFKQVEQIMVAFGALKLIDERSMNDLAEYLVTKQFVKYKKGDSYLKLRLQSGKEIHLNFSK